MRKVKSVLGNKLCVGMVLLLLVFLSKLPTMGLDYHWDSLALAAQSKYYSINGPLSIPPGIIVHTPFLPWTISSLYVFFGESAFLSHFLIAVFSFLGIFMVYLLVSDLYAPSTGFIASIIVFSSSMYFSLSGQLLYDIPLVSMTMAVLYFNMKRMTKMYIISASILVITKEPGILAILAILLLDCRGKGLKNFARVLTPIAAVVLWALFLLPSLGKIGPGGYFSGTPGFLMAIEKAATIIYTVFAWNYNWIPACLLAYMVFRRKAHIDRKFNTLMATALLYFLFFAFFPTFILPRYILLITVTLYVLVAASMDGLKDKSKIICVCILIALFVSTYRFNYGLKGSVQDPVFQWVLSDPISSVRSRELSLDYADILQVEGDAISYIADNYRGSKMLATFPLAESASIDTNVGRRQWKKLNITVMTDPTIDNINSSDLIIVESYGNFNADKQRQIGVRRILKHFEANGNAIDVYGGKA